MLFCPGCLKYGIDGLYSYNYSDKPPKSDALIVSMGYHTIHIIPVLDGEIMFGNSRRMNIGGFHVVSFLHRMLQLKYPAHTNAITLSRAEELLHTICLIALDYRVELNKWMDPDYYETNTKRIQLPYTANVCTAGLTAKGTEKELARRLIEINARKREERLAEDEEKLQQLLEIQDNDWNDYEQEKAFTEYQIKNYEDLQKNIAFLTSRIEKNKRKIAAAMNGEEIVEEPPIKQVKTNKFVFETEKALQTFVQNAKKKRQEILNRKAARKQRKQDMAKRRTAAGQERMRIISQLARKEKGNDDFGLRDEDWDIYKTISRDGADSDSETENEKLLELEEIIRTHEPSEEDDTFGPGEAHQLHIGVERYRAPELIFKPYMIGSSEAGLSEVIGYVLSLFNDDDQLRLASNIVLTGGPANLPGLQERVHSDLISIRPFKSFSAVSVLPNCTLSSWYGAKAWAHTDDFKKTLITKQDYDELGGDF
ncbi:actin [Holotrichia oblita]|uniref:Actin n=1 Tax=Holotrichia oblita TaxID=644536 RepID=A0ACB9SWB4_HOLOL|nr:actin [Holotrichia oblita]